jgi:hypothetical protein
MASSVEKTKVYEIVEISNVSKRCADYCEAAPFCEQWRRINPNKLAL